MYKSSHVDHHLCHAVIDNKNLKKTKKLILVLFHYNGAYTICMYGIRHNIGYHVSMPYDLNAL